jgi:EAL domain-containing protein (putative c-di-GMP-specific phosphodiesterase class I)
MSVDFFHRIGYRLTRSTVVIAFILGILISIVQVLVDFKKLRWLEQYKHVWYQGYYFSRPLEQSKFIELMKQQVLKPENTTTI